MPTPSDSVTHVPFTPSNHLGYSSHATCPPDIRDRESEYGQSLERDSRHTSPGPAPQHSQHSESEPSSHTALTNNNNSANRKMPGALLDDHEDYLSSSSGEISETSSGDSIDTVRPQIPESSLTADHPTLTTFFEGEIIGPKYTFQTRHPSWGATDKTDMQHWARFPAWRPLAKQAKKPDFHYKNFAQRENIFMRWKESFLVPDHRVREISGASFEGFYYICFNQVSGDINGIYFHAKSEKYQQLELKHVPDRGCFPAMEFR
ncbi:MAG: hypothetical protein Q9170_005023 [Blastenia crenularia]